MNDKLTILFRIPQLKLFKQPVRLRIMILHSDEGLFLRSMLIMFIFLFGSGSLKCHAQGNASQKLWLWRYDFSGRKGYNQRRVDCIFTRPFCPASWNKWRNLNLYLRVCHYRELNFSNILNFWEWKTVGNTCYTELPQYYDRSLFKEYQIYQLQINPGREETLTKHIHHLFRIKVLYHGEEAFHLWQCQ